MEERKGFFTSNQEKGIDNLIELKGVAEAIDGAAIRMVDNIALEKLKDKVPEDVLPIVYSVIDEIFLALGVEK